MTRRRIVTVVLAAVVIVPAVAWTLTFGPIGTRSDDHYGDKAAAEYESWLKKRGRARAAVKSCEPLRTGLEVYGRPGYYSCVVGSSTRCVIIDDDLTTDLGPMSRAQCIFLIND